MMLEEPPPPFFLRGYLGAKKIPQSKYLLRKTMSNLRVMVMSEKRLTLVKTIQLNDKFFTER